MREQLAVTAAPQELLGVGHPFTLFVVFAHV